MGSTGGVITAAGLIFAASMFGLLFASISTIVQAGFVVGTGILLDTFLVRTVTVPAMAVLVGRANWWPSRWRPRPPPPAKRTEQLPAPAIAMPDGEEEVVTNPGGQEPVDPVSGHRGKVDFTGVRWGSVEWTNLCMLYLRACESRLAQPILGGHFAAQDVARIDYDFRRIHRRVRPAANQFVVALRGAQFDAWITDYLNGHPDAVVLHLGCGLDSRAFRMATPEGVRWFDVDLPHVIALRRQLYSESNRTLSDDRVVGDRSRLAR